MAKKPYLAGRYRPAGNNNMWLVHQPCWVIDTETISDIRYLCEELNVIYDPDKPEKKMWADVSRAYVKLEQDQKKALLFKMDKFLENNLHIPKADALRALEKMRTAHMKGPPFSGWALQTVVAACAVRVVLTYDVQIPNEPKLVHINFCGVTSFNSIQRDESSLLQNIANEYHTHKPITIGWNTSGYDFQVLRSRMALPQYGIETPEYLIRVSQPFKRYGDMYNERHIDVMRKWALGGRFAKLDDASRAMNGPGKIGTEGDKVLAAVLKGNLKDVIAYCECDVLNTFYMYLVWMRREGLLSDNVYNKVIAQKTAYLEKNQRDDNHYGEYLQKWRAASKGKLLIGQN